MSAHIIELSPKPARVTPQEVMKMDSFKDFTEEQAKELLHIVEAFCEIAYNIWQRQESKKLKKTTVIPLSPSKKRAA